jgi:hypothetical protein
MVWHLQVHLNGFGVRFFFPSLDDILKNKMHLRKSIDFVLSKVTPILNTSLGYKMFLLFATIDIGGLAVFSLYDLVTTYKN